MSGYVGCGRDDEFVLRLLEISPSLEFVTIDTDSEYYERKPWVCATSDRCTKDLGPYCICMRQGTGARTRMEAKERAEHLKFRFPPTTLLTVM
ncbi:hypothetical protein PHJA_001311500 [Phtheirospermum japonicum]|uniref:Uncharacterized protein n=1 Tax=Phtheirospermum japonicum TaxID=374723 RepID=A0A830C8W5_9LAMI|nr:hypothetical protein PHJA_001311500 [Phtheirospermum japonicum]